MVYSQKNVVHQAKWDLWELTNNIGTRDGTILGIKIMLCFGQDPMFQKKWDI